MRLPRPFRGLRNPREVWAWGMFDLANQSFTLLINTLLFAVFFREVVVGAGGRWAAHDDTLWAVLVAVSLGLVVIASPIAGAIADRSATKKRMLMGLGVACAALTCSLALIPSGGAGGASGAMRALVIAACLYIPANFAYQLGENFVASFLPEIAERKEMGKVSGIGWTMGYVGALALLLLTVAGMKIFNMGQTDQWRPFFVFAGVWFLVMATPTALFLKERATPMPVGEEGGGGLVRSSFVGLGKTLRQATEFRHLARFLVAFLVYGFGVQVVIFFSAPIAKDFGFDQTKLALFMLQLTITAGIAAVLTGMYQDRFGRLRTVKFFLLVWTFNAACLAGLAMLKHSRGAGPVPEWPMWVIGNGIGIGLGGIGTASRALVGSFTPAHRTAEFFGLWGLVYKLAGCIGVLSFGVIKDWMGDVAALVMLASFFVVGFVVLLTVDQDLGERAAEGDEAAHRGRDRDAGLSME